MDLIAGVYFSCWECWCVFGNAHRNFLKETFHFNGDKDQRLSDVPDSTLAVFVLLSLQPDPLEKAANIPADGIWAHFPV